MRSKDYWRHLFEDAGKENETYLQIWSMLEDLSGKDIQDIMLSLSTNSKLRLLKTEPFRSKSPFGYQKAQDELLAEIKKNVAKRRAQ